MSLFLYLVWHFASKRVRSGTALLFLLLVAVSVFAGFVSMAGEQGRTASFFQSYYGPSQPMQALDIGSAHTQVWVATNQNLRITERSSQGIFLPLRMATPWLLFILPLVGLLLASREVSQDIESGVAQTLHAAPVSPVALGMARVLGDSLATALLIGLGLGGAILVGSRFVPLGVNSAELVRGLLLMLILGLYTSVFLLVGTLVSTISRNSLRALWVCVGIGLAVFGAHLMVENLSTAQPPPYPNVPWPPASVNEYLYRVSGIQDPMARRAMESRAPAEFLPYLASLRTHAATVQRMLDARYQDDRWLGLVSPADGIRQVAAELLQDRHASATEIFAPLPPAETPVSIWVSLRQTFPELLGLVLVWLGLFALNVRALSLLEV